jgi:hypothetical protein
MANDRNIVRSRYNKSAFLIKGIAVTAAPTSNKQIFNPAGCQISVPCPLMLDHDLSLGPVGRVFEMRKSATEVAIRAELFDDEAAYAAWVLIKGGALGGLSIGLGYGRGEFEVLELNGTDYFTRFRISEVSLVFEPANKQCRFKVDPAGAQKLDHPVLVRSRKILSKPFPWERQKGRSLSDAEKLRKMHPVSRELLLDLRRRGLTRTRKG